MKKENYFDKTSFKEFLYELARNDTYQNNTLRKIYQGNSDNQWFIALEIFKKNVFSKEIGLNLQNDLGMQQSENAKAISSYILDGDNTLSYKTINTQINETLEEFIALSHAGNELSKQLHEDIYLKLLNMREIIEKDINDLNNI